HRWLTCLAVLGLAGSVAIPAAFVEINMNDESESDRIALRYQVNGEYSLEKVREAVDLIEAYLYENQDAFELETVYSFYNTNSAGSTLVLRQDRTQSSSEIREA